MSQGGGTELVLAAGATLVGLHGWPVGAKGIAVADGCVLEGKLSVALGRARSHPRPDRQGHLAGALEHIRAGPLLAGTVQLDLARPTGSVEGGAEGHGVLRVNVDGDGSTQLGLHQLGHQRYARRAAHQQHRRDLLGSDAGGVEGPAQRPDRLAERWADHRLELATGDPDLGLHTGEQHRNRRLAVSGQRLLGLDALLAQAGERGQRGGVVVVESVEGPIERSGHEAEDGLVEIDATQAIDALGGTEDLEAGRGLAQHGGIEGAAAEVVDGDDLARFDTGRAGVVDGGRLRLAQRAHVGEPGQANRLRQQIELVGAPVGGMGQRDGVGLPALTVGDGGDHRAQELGHERLG